MNIKHIILIWVIFSLVLVSGISGCAQEDNVITTQGNSEITVNPDEAEVVVGISILKDSAADAQNEANAITTSIINGLKTEGIPEVNIQTEQLSLYEEYDWSSGTQKTKGWRATQTLRVKTTDLSNVGTIVDIAVENGANQISSINFGLSSDKEQEYKTQALADATTNAKEKAETIALSLGAKLGNIKSVSESGFYYTPYRYAMEEVAGASAVKEAAAVMPGQVSVTASISIVYKIA